MIVKKVPPELMRSTYHQTGVYMEEILARNMYKDIKNMNREQMKSFLKRIYEDGYKKALEDHPASSFGPDLEKLRNEISAINGIGEKRLEDIMEVIKRNV